MLLAVLTVLVFSIITNTSHFIEIGNKISIFFSSNDYFKSIFFDRSLTDKILLKLVSLDLLLGGLLNTGLCKFLLNYSKSNIETKCLKESKKMMESNKFDFFILDLSFIGWDILSLLTFGIAGLFIPPYKKLTETHFYLALKDSYY